MAPRTMNEILDGHGDRPALLLAGVNHTLTRDQLRCHVELLAQTLVATGIKPGDVVSIANTNTLEYIVTFLAINWARAIAAPLNSNYETEEFKFYLEDAQSKLLVLPTSGNTKAEAAAKDRGVPTATFAFPKGAHNPGVLAGKSQQLQVHGRLDHKLDKAKGDDLALFLHTSGTTSKPKGVPLSHANLTASLANIIATYELHPSDRSMLVMPLFHVHGLMAGLLAPLAAGSAVILPLEGRFAPGTFWRDVVQHRATFYTAVPTMHQILLARAAKEYPRESPPSLRFIRSCSSSLAASTLHKLEAAFHAPVLEAYAMTEAAHQMTSNPLPSHGAHKPGTVGRAQGSVQVAILDTANRKVPTGQVGEVCIRGPNVTKGYLNRPEANKEAYAGGWFHTGDQGKLDQDGYLELTGRLKELINRGGEKISPIEVDSALLAHPLVKEAVAFGAPDEKYGEIVAAAVVLNSAPADEKAAIKDIKLQTGKRIAAFKVPTRIFITDNLPKTATGKIQRRKMVDHFMNGSASGQSPSGGGQKQIRSKL